MRSFLFVSMTYWTCCLRPNTLPLWTYPPDIGKCQWTWIHKSRQHLPLTLVYMNSRSSLWIVQCPGHFSETNGLAGLTHDCCTLYLDNVLVIGKTFNDLTNLRKVSSVLAWQKLKLRAEKCFFCECEVEYLGHVVSRCGISVYQSKVAVVQDCA